MTCALPRDFTKREMPKRRSSPAGKIKAFTVNFPDHQLEDLRHRLARTRWIDDLGDGDWEYGLSLPYFRELVDYWQKRFDWRATETAINRFSHFHADIDGRKIHFIHERGRGPDPLPIVLTHGFPDSFLRFAKIIPMLADPASYGAHPTDSFDVVVPSLPGYAFSDPPAEAGATFKIADTWHQLMTKFLGYKKYAAQGGDWGSLIIEMLARDHSGSVVGIHMTDVPYYHALRKPKKISRKEKKYLDAIEKFTSTEGGYAVVQGSQTQALALGLNDSPAGLAAWLLEKFRRWSDCDGDLENRFSKDEQLAHVMIYWLTGTINSSFAPYYDVAHAGMWTWVKQMMKGWTGSSDVPAAFAMFPKDLSHPPREWAERFFNVERWTEMPRGGHFAALEEPELLAKDIRDFFRRFR